MAKAPFSMKSHDLLLDYVKQMANQQGAWWRNKLEATDLLYYCMSGDIAKSTAIQHRLEELELDKSAVLEAPVIISQIETAVAVLMDTFLSGYPLFGVVASPERQQQAQQVETLIAYYDERGAWKNNLIRFFRAATKYYVAPIGLADKYGYDLMAEIDLGDTTGSKARKVNAYVLPDLITPDPYNMLFDYRVLPAELATQGDYVGYAKMMTHVSVRAMITAMQNAGNLTGEGLVNLDKLDETTIPYDKYYMHPVINDVGTSPQGRWDIWLAGNARVRNRLTAEAYYYNKHAFVRRLWIRILPEDFELTRYASRTPHVFELITFNDQYIIYFQPVYLRDNSFPLGMVDMQNDDFGYNGKSEVDLFAPFQRAATTLLTAAALGAERSVDDRAIYDPNYISKANLTRKSGSAYIPLTKSLAMDKAIPQVYHSTPFDASASYALPSLIREIVGTAQMFRGRNNFAQGLPQKGNRTLGEFSEVQQNSDTRQQMPAMLLEATAFTDCKSWIKQWITNKATPTTRLNQRTKAAVQIDPQTIAEIDYEFALSTGYFSKAMLAGSDVVEQALQAIITVPPLQQGYDLPKLFAYLMSLKGAKDLDQFQLAPQQQQQNAALAAQAEGAPQQPQVPGVPM
jgi:hypothetical protein